MLDNISEEIVEEPKSADEIDEQELPKEEDSVIKVKKPRSQKQIITSYSRRK